MSSLAIVLGFGVMLFLPCAIAMLGSHEEKDEGVLYYDGAVEGAGGSDTGKVAGAPAARTTPSTISAPAVKGPAIPEWLQVGGGRGVSLRGAAEVMNGLSAVRVAAVVPPAAMPSARMRAEREGSSGARRSSAAAGGAIPAATWVTPLPAGKLAPKQGEWGDLSDPRAPGRGPRTSQQMRQAQVARLAHELRVERAEIEALKANAAAARAKAEALAAVAQKAAEKAQAAAAEAVAAEAEAHQAVLGTIAA